jgi:hypothetical protein
LKGIEDEAVREDIRVQSKMSRADRRGGTHWRKSYKPVAELARYRQRKRNAFGILKGRLFITGDIISPIDVEWNALK